MNKLYFLVLGISLLLLGCIQPGVANVTTTVKEYVCADGRIVANPALCPNITVTTAPTARNLSRDEQLSVCTGMPESQGTSLEDLCVVGLAAKSKDPSICQEVSRDTRPTCYALVAAEKSDVNVCAEAGTYKDTCYEAFARNTQNATACDKISDFNKKDGCYSTLSSMLRDPTLCDKISYTGQKDSCYWNMAMQFRDSSYCNKMTSSDQKQNCLQNLAGTQGGPMKG